MSDETHHDDTSTSDSEDAANGRRRTAADSPFSLDALQQLVEMMEQHSLSEISLQTGETKWKLRRGPETLPGLPAAYVPPPQPPVALPQESPAPAPAATAPAAGGVFIKSPTVGTFYSAATPEDPPFVNVGTRVQPETVVCLVEAMKVFNQIPAEVSGVIAEVLISNGDSVEFGQPLFRITPG